MNNLDPNVARNLSRLFSLYKADETNDAADYLSAISGFPVPYQMNALTDYCGGHAPDSDPKWMPKPMQIRARCQFYQNHADDAAQRRAVLIKQRDEADNLRIEGPKETDEQRQAAVDRLMGEYMEDFNERNQSGDKLGAIADATTPETFKNRRYKLGQSLSINVRNKIKQGDEL